MSTGIGGVLNLPLGGENRMGKVAGGPTVDEGVEKKLWVREEKNTREQVWKCYQCQ